MKAKLFSILFTFIIFYGNAQSDKTELKTVLQHLIKGDSSSIVKNLSAISKMKSKDGFIQFKKIGVSMKYLYADGTNMTTILPTNKLFIDGQVISEPLDIHEVEKAIDIPAEYALINDFSKTGKTLIKLTKYYVNSPVDFYFSLEKPLFSSSIIGEEIQIDSLRVVTTETRFNLVKIQSQRIGAVMITRGLGVEVRLLPKSSYVGKTDEETLENLKKKLEESPSSDKQNILRTIVSFHAEKSDYQEAIVAMEQLVDLTNKHYKGGILDLMELYIVNQNFEGVLALNQKYGKTLRSNEHRFLGQLYVYFANYLMGKEDSRTLNDCKEALKFLDFEQMNWSFDLLKNDIRSFNKREDYTDENKAHLLEVINEVEAANFLRKSKKETAYFVTPPPPPIKSNTVKAGEDPIYTTVEVSPEFKEGGSSGMYKYIGENLKFPEAAKAANITGKVFIKFVVEKDGTIGDAVILKGLGFGCDEEASRVIKSMPAWKPGYQNGKPARVYFTIPVSFRLDNN